MSHKKILLPITLGVFALGVSVASSPVMASASASEWGADSVTVTDITNGVSIDNQFGWGRRAYLKEKVQLDGFMFEYKISGLINGEAAGFYFHNGISADKYFSETTSAVFSIWQPEFATGQTRIYFLNSTHDLGKKDKALTVNAPTSEATKGFSSADYALIGNRSESFTLKVTFEEVSDEYYKITINGADWK